MTAHDSRRALRLASLLVAAGLALTAAPHALAADSGSDAMHLTSKQADTLAKRLQSDGPVDDKAADDAQSKTGAASGTGASTDSNSLSMTATSKIEGVRGYGATVPVGNKKGDYFTLHTLGHIARTTADGTEQWSRDSASLYADWKVKHLRVWETEFYPPRLLMGYNAVSPFTPTSGQGYDTGDLTGDGVPDVVFSASVGMSPPSGVVVPGTTMTSGTFVTILDGATGRTMWSKFYAFAGMVKIVDGALLVADAPRQNDDAPATATAKITGTRFSYAGGALGEASSWTYDTGEVQPATWGAVQDLGGGRAAVSWNLRKTDITTARGRTLVLDTNDGSVQWQTDSALYGRQLGLDSGRGRLVAVEQADLSDEVRYQVAAYDLKTGRRTTLTDRVNVLPTAFTVGDLSESAADEYAVSESSLTDSLFVNASTVRVLDGDDPDTALWQHTTKRAADNGHDGPSTWRLTVVGSKLVAAGQDDTKFGTAINAAGRYGSLTVFNAKGKVAWQTKGATASPTFQDIFKDKAGRHIRTVDSDQNVRTYDLAGGAQQQLTPLQADMAYGKALDVDGDKKADLIEGGQSNGVWAYSGTSLLDGKPKQLWRAALPGAVHRIEVADVTGDKTPEIVVAADSAVVVLDSRTGATLRTIDGGGHYVRSVALSDLDGDGKKDILVPTNKLTAYKGSGKQLWSYAAPADAGDVYFSDVSVNDGHVYVQYASDQAFTLDNPTLKAVQLDAGTGALGWASAPKAPAGAQDGRVRGGLFDNAVYSSPAIPYADGHGVAYTWVVWAPAGATASDGFSPFNVTEIRDGRTGEILHTAIGGGLWTHSNYLNGDGVLLEAGTAAIRTYGPDGKDNRVVLIPPTGTATWFTAPGGRRVVLTGTAGGPYLWDPAVLSGGQDYPDYLGKSPTISGSRNFVTGDFDGDGDDEVVALNFDDRGVNQTAEQTGGGYYVPNNNIHGVTALKVS
ncbi:FG-GAP-like repeat-containing protein [Streptomyces sp. NPDC102467]|uniref:FG-GAP-like repeat-containing protein n=1 Tax=Streptomyces sp. NPDC102467 TaxID=3366179 RepID=UPI00380E6548